MAEYLNAGHLRGILDLLSDDVEVRIAVSPTDPGTYTVGEPAITGNYQSGNVTLTLPAAEADGRVSADAAEQMGWAKR